MLQTVTVTLARCREHPDGRLDVNLWRRERDHCRAHRFWTGEPDRHGRLVHPAGGPDGATWLIDCDCRTTDDDEPGFRLGGHRLVAGELVSIRDADRDLRRTFEVAHAGNRRGDPA